MYCDKKEIAILRLSKKINVSAVPVKVLKMDLSMGQMEILVRNYSVLFWKDSFKQWAICLSSLQICFLCLRSFFLLKWNVALKSPRNKNQIILLAWINLIQSRLAQWQLDRFLRCFLQCSHVCLWILNFHVKIQFLKQYGIRNLDHIW